jgi:hypothetical protein
MNLMTPEGRVKNDVKKVLKARGIWYFMPMQNGFGVVGIPDFICCWEGHFLAIETKAPGKRGDTTANQDRKLQEIQDHGGYSLVVDDVQQLIDFLEASSL